MDIAYSDTISIIVRIPPHILQQSVEVIQDHRRSYLLDKSDTDLVDIHLHLQLLEYVGRLLQPQESTPDFRPDSADASGDHLLSDTCHLDVYWVL